MRKRTQLHPGPLLRQCCSARLTSLDLAWDGIVHAMIHTISAHLTTEELQTGLDHIRRSPKDEGVLDLIVRRQAINEREVVEHAELDLVQGLIGDTWNRRRSTSTPDGSP